jgi:hypothetical protein
MAWSVLSGVIEQYFDQQLLARFDLISRSNSRKDRYLQLRSVLALPGLPLLRHSPGCRSPIW